MGKNDRKLLQQELDQTLATMTTEINTLKEDLKKYNELEEKLEDFYNRNY